MFRFRRIFSADLPNNRLALAEVQQIVRKQFPSVRDEDVDGLGQRLREPFTQKFRAMMLVAEDAQRSVIGFAAVLHDPVLRFCYLDYLATQGTTTSHGVGGALYEKVREEAMALGARGLFFESLPDDPLEVSSAEEFEQNCARLRFYERHGARPLVDNNYRRPVNQGELDWPYLLYDGLGVTGGPSAAWTRQVVRAVLENKYAYLCSPEYIMTVACSFTTDPVPLRPPRYSDVVAEAPPVQAAYYARSS